MNFEWGKTNENVSVYNYFTQGIAASEVELDILSGSFRVIRSDILMDVGKSLNPSIDIGQIEGNILILIFNFNFIFIFIFRSFSSRFISIYFFVKI